MSVSFNSIMQIAQQIEDLRVQRDQIASYLSNAVVSSNILCRVLGKLDDEQAFLLMHYVSPLIDDDSETTWEEATVAATGHLLRTCLTKKSGQQQQPQLIVQTQIEPLENTDKLKKQLHAVYERIIQGGRISE